MYPPLRAVVIILSVLSLASSFNSVHAAPPASRDRDLGAAADDINVLYSYAAEMTVHADNLHQLVQEFILSPSADVEPECMTEALGFMNSLQGLQDTLAKLSVDEDLDPGHDIANALLTLLAEMDSVEQELDDDAADLIRKLPVIGPPNSPIAEQIEDLLTNITRATIQSARALTNLIEDITTGV